MREKFPLIIIHTLIIVGLFLVFSGLVMSEAPIDVEQSSFTETEPINTEDIIEYEEQFNEYEPVLPGEEDEMIDTYNISDFSNETQDDLHKLINNETDMIQITEVTEGEFMVNFENNNTYLFEGIDSTIDPLMISLWGYVLIIFAAILFIRLPSNKRKNKNNNVTELLEDVEVADEDSEWDYVIVDEDETED